MCSADLAPPQPTFFHKQRDKATQFFGLFAFSGKVTAFLAPFVIAAVTSATRDQRLGVASIVVFLILGLLVMLSVRVRRES